MSAPTWSDCYVLETNEAVDLADQLKASGYLAKREISAVCSRDPITGEHTHRSGIVVTLTPAQARRLIGGKR